MKRILFPLLLAIAACAGADGAIGPIGQTGAAGRDGRDGIDGKDGAPGAAAVLDSAGYERIAAIVLPQMPKPLDGKDGAAGRDGRDGTDGKNGIDGKDGKDGAGVVGDSLRLRKLVVDGEIRVGTAVDDPRCPNDASESLILCSLTGASIGFLANANGLWPQLSQAGYSTIGMSPDLGLRLCQNQRWARDGRHVEFIANHPEYAETCTGNDSRGVWSWNWLKQGRPNHATQQMVLDEDENRGILFFTTWRADRRIGIRTSSCKFCFDQEWIAPTKP